MDAYQPPPPYMRPPSGPPPPTDPYHQYYQHQSRPPMPPPPAQHGGPAWYPNQFHNPHSPSPPPPPPQQWGPPPSAYPPPYQTHSHQPPFNAVANGNSQFPVPPGEQLPPPYPQANQEWGNQNWGYQQQQGHAQTAQANSNTEDWEVKAREWAAINAEQHSLPPPNGQAYQQYPTQGYQDVHQQAAPGLSYQQYPVPQPTTQPERYPSFPGGSSSSAGLSHQENVLTGSAFHQQEVPYSYSSVSGKEEPANANQMSVPDNGGPVRAEQQIQYTYGDQTSAHAPPGNFSDQPSQFATKENSDYASLHNTWPPHAATGVVHPPQHNSSMAMPSGHTMPPFGAFPQPNLQPVGPPYAFGTKPPLHSPVAVFMDDSYAASSGPPKKAPVPNWLKEELLKNKASVGRPSSVSFEERESIEDDVHYSPPAKVEHREDRRISPSKSSDEEEDDDEEDERDVAINLEIKRILTEVLLKVTDELFDEIATKVINEDESIPKADPTHNASAEILVSVGDANRKESSSSPGDLLGLASYASDDDDDNDTDTDAALSADANGSAEVETLGVGSTNNVNWQPSSEKGPEPNAMVNERLGPEAEIGDMSPKNNNSGFRDDVERSSNTNLNRTGSHKEAKLDEPQRKNPILKPDSNLHLDSNKSSGKDLSHDLSQDRSRTDRTKTGNVKVDSQNGSKDHRMKEKDIKSAEKVKGSESNDLNAKKDARDGERRPHRTNSKEDRSRKKEKEEKHSRRRHDKDSSKDKRRRSPTSNGSSDDSIRKSRSRRRNVSPSPVRSRRRRSSPSSDESSDDTRRKSSSRRKNRSPSPGKSKKRHVSSRSPHSKHSEHKHSSSHDKPRSKRSRSRSPRRRHRA